MLFNVSFHPLPISYLSLSSTTTIRIFYVPDSLPLPVKPALNSQYSLFIIIPFVASTYLFSLFLVWDSRLPSQFTYRLASRGGRTKIIFSNIHRKKLVTITEFLNLRPVKTFSHKINQVKKTIKSRK